LLLKFNDGLISSHIIGSIKGNAPIVRKISFIGHVW